MQPATPSKKLYYTGYVISILCGLFLLMDGGMKIAQAGVVLEASKELGLPESITPGLGIVLCACTIVYLIPQTAMLGAILLTGYLGGAVATHVRVMGPIFPVIFPILFGILVWLGLYLRDRRLWALVPLRSSL